MSVSVWPAFHDADNDTDTDILARIVARMSVSVSVLASWNVSFRAQYIELSQLMRRRHASVTKVYIHVAELYSDHQTAT